jgi:hypothetical protein
MKSGRLGILIIILYTPVVLSFLFGIIPLWFLEAYSAFTLLTFLVSRFQWLQKFLSAIGILLAGLIAFSLIAGLVIAFLTNPELHVPFTFLGILFLGIIVFSIWKRKELFGE